MGTYLAVRDAPVYILPHNIKPAADALRAQVAIDALNGRRHYAWIDPANIVRAPDDISVFIAWRWKPIPGPDGAIENLDFTGVKLGNDEEFFSTIAPFVENGSYVECEADGSMWRWIFRDGKLHVHEGEVAWTDGTTREVRCQARLCHWRTADGRIVRVTDATLADPLDVTMVGSREALARLARENMQPVFTVDVNEGES